jgi:hypothetical protein
MKTDPISIILHPGANLKRQVGVDFEQIIGIIGSCPYRRHPIDVACTECSHLEAPLMIPCALN